MRSGKVLYGDANVVSAVPNTGTCDAVDANVCGVNKLVCLQSDIGKSYSALKTAAGNIYPAYFCGTPMNEPSCVPSRPTSVMIRSYGRWVAASPREIPRLWIHPKPNDGVPALSRPIHEPALQPPRSTIRATVCRR